MPGDPVGAEFQVNFYTTSLQGSPDVAAESDGDFVVVWQSSGSNGNDSAATSIQGQRYRVTGDVGDRVWRDLDLDGLQGPGEPGVAGVTVHLFDSFGELRRSTMSGPEGLYRFEPKPGDYYLQFEAPRELSFSTVNRLDDDTLDSDADVLTGETDTESREGARQSQREPGVRVEASTPVLRTVAPPSWCCQIPPRSRHNFGLACAA